MPCKEAVPYYILFAPHLVGIQVIIVTLLYTSTILHAAIESRLHEDYLTLGTGTRECFPIAVFPDETYGEKHLMSLLTFHGLLELKDL